MTMKKAHKYFILLALSLMMTVNLVAQNLPSAPSDPSVKTGVLPNGMSYYLAVNPTTDKIADFALVQRTGLNDLGYQARTVARDGLNSLPRFKTSPQEFLASHGVAPTKDGFVKVSDNATLYHFDNVILAEEAIDSVLLVLMDIADRGTSAEHFVWNWYTPEDQAVIISGDIEADKLASKLRMLSYMTPARQPMERKQQIWQDTEEPLFEVLSGASSDISTVSATWVSPRIKKEYMNTVQPAIYTMFINELGYLSKERLVQKFRQKNIPVADISYEHVSSLSSFGSEKFIVRVSVAPEQISKAVEVLASTMSSIDQGTASIYEYEVAKRRYLADLEKGTRSVVRSNSDYVQQCASAFLYGAPIASSKEIYPFLKYRSLEAATELQHFNNITSALLDGKRNLTVSCVDAKGSDFTKSQLQEAFSKAWESDKSEYGCIQPADSLQFPELEEPIKLQKFKKDPMSGGQVWTFENGFQVVYKRQAAGNRMYYALAMNGGYGNIKGLSYGEGAYVSDYLNLSRVSGLSSNDFRIALEEKGMSLNANVGISNTVIDGSVPETELDMMMNALLAYVNKREYDKAAFEYYKSCMELEHDMMEGSVRDRIVAIDSLMCPGYEFSSLKTSGKITSKFPDKVEAFWAVQSSKMNDGVLVLVGNIEETKLRKLLQNYVGCFKTTDRTYPRLNVSYQPVSGTTAYAYKGNRNSVDMALSSRLPLTADNYLASNIAASVLKQMISKEIAGTGMYLRLVHECRIYPQERFNMMITLEEADPQGFAQDIELTGAGEALAILRKVLEDLPTAEIDAADLAKHKEVLKGHIALQVSAPEYWVRAITKRYLDGKDFTTSYASKVDAVTADKVKQILSALSTTGRVEYIIEK